jgi:hypothetical protein
VVRSDGEAVSVSDKYPPWYREMVHRERGTCSECRHWTRTADPFWGECAKFESDSDRKSDPLSRLPFAAIGPVTTPDDFGCVLAEPAPN